MTPPRPTRNDQTVLAMFYKLFAEEMKKNCAELCIGMSLQEIEDALLKSGRPDSDGYEYAKKLERDGWDDITADDVEVLDGAFSVLLDAHESIVSQWVKDSDIKPGLNDGDLCAYKGETGTVHYNDRNMKHGVYLFRSAKWIAENGNQGGQCVNWEDIDGEQAIYSVTGTDEQSA
jgi:hypothetical protein